MVENRECTQMASCQHLELTKGGGYSRAYGRVICIEMTSTKNTIVTDEICPTLTSRMGTGGNQVNAVFTTK